MVLDAFNNLAVVPRMLDHSKCIFEWSKEPKRRFLAIFWSLLCWIDLILHIVIVLNVFQLSAASPGHEGSFKKYKNAFLNDSKSQKEVFGHFLEFGLLDRLHIAYCDSIKCFPTFGSFTRSWRIIQKVQECIFEWSKEPKKWFLVIFCSWVCWIDLMLHIVKVLNIFQLWTTLPYTVGTS